jgi:hypothetical protein
MHSEYESQPDHHEYALALEGRAINVAIQKTGKHPRAAKFGNDRKFIAMDLKECARGNFTILSQYTFLECPPRFDIDRFYSSFQPCA